MLAPLWFLPLSFLAAIQPPPALEVKPTPAATTAAYKTVEDILLALEKADAELKTLQADMMYDRVFGIAGDRRIRIGHLYFQNDGPASPGALPRRRFAFRTDTLQIGSRLQAEQLDLIFDGAWLIERNHGTKQFIARRIVKEGESFDPLRLGEGPFPVPIGQKRNEILKRYDAELLPAEQGLEANDDTPESLERLRAFVKDTYQVHLTPKAEIREGEELRDVRLWYAPVGGASGRLLPKLARTVNRSQDVSLVQLVGWKVNEAVPTDVLDTTPPTDPAWQVQGDGLAPKP